LSLPYKLFHENDDSSEAFNHYSIQAVGYNYEPHISIVASRESEENIHEMSVV
jgi:hypothetical protein